MKDFFRTFLAVIVALIVVNVIAFFMFLVMIASLSALQTPKPIVSANSVLTISLKDPIVDQPSASQYNINLLSGQFEMGKSLGLREVTQAIKYAAEDPNILGISLEISSIPTSISLLEEVRTALLDFKKSGKFITAYSSEGYSQKGYYIASVADQVFLNPVGGFEFQGLCYAVPFFKDFFDKFHIDMQVIRHGKYKSAVEPYLSNKMSEANREQITAFVSSIWSDMLKPISESRTLSIEELNHYADELSVTTAMEAKNKNFINDILYVDEYKALLCTKTHAESEKALKKINLDKYISTVPNKKPVNNGETIAIVYAQGDIISGKSNQSSMGDETICEALRQARQDKDVKAIVFRVNSPGGSALASDIILREVKLAAEEKPVIVTMGTYAASGGYYISCAADYIFADPTTLTGSIGVFGMVPCFQKLLKEDLKINFESVQTNKNSDYMKNLIAERLSPYQTQIIQNEIELIYNTFLTHVAEGRNMTIAQVDSIAQGRVWTGSEAINIGLVDALGDLNDAIAYAANQVGLTDYKIREFPKQKGFLEEIKENLNILAPLKSAKYTYLTPFVKALEDAATMKGVQARLPFVVIDGE